MTTLFQVVQGFYWDEEGKCFVSEPAVALAAQGFLVTQETLVAMYALHAQLATELYKKEGREDHGLILVEAEGIPSIANHPSVTGASNNG